MMSDYTLCKKGDWVSFMQAGKIVIGQVEYERKDILGYYQYFTTIGTVRDDQILEVRTVRTRG